jgi:hypothetical protein
MEFGILSKNEIFSAWAKCRFWRFYIAKESGT